MRRITMVGFAVTLSVLAVLLALPGCGRARDEAGGGNYFNPDEDQLQEFLDAIPSQESLTLSLPEGEKAGGGLGELAELYDQTVDFTREVNEHVLMFLSWIDEITSYPPSSGDDDSFTWGPWSDGGLSPVEARFRMTRVAEREYDYVLQWREKGTDDPWTDIWSGHTNHVTDTARRGIGTFSVDFSAARTLDPSRNEEGQVGVEYDTVTDGREITVHYVDFYNHEEDMTGPTDADYFYHNHADDTGSFLFDWLGDIHYDQYHGEQYAAVEHAWFNTRWQSLGAGRSDVVFTDGDIPSFQFEGEPFAEYLVSECWGDDFLRDYYSEAAKLENGSEVPIFEEGEESACVFDPASPH